MRNLAMKLLFVGSVSLFAASALAFNPPYWGSPWAPGSSGLVNYGGEIPWPFLDQTRINKASSEGLWKITTLDKKEHLLNVEMLENEDKELTWLRVSELDLETYEVISWGEGFYQKGGNSVSTEDGIPLPLAKDKVGQYIYLFSSSDYLQDPILLRLVQVKLKIGDALGVSIYPVRRGETAEHMLGVRMLETPLSCTPNQDLNATADLICELPDLTKIDDGSTEEPCNQ
ncbi:MAG: hypothetical protein KDD33_13480 [Bdellovibrionales bacterium]|nr:hypothetical protein [Bdellovibrionales bacterium]